jgi:hypothetical protein
MIGHTIQNNVEPYASYDENKKVKGRTVYTANIIVEVN